MEWILLVKSVHSVFLNILQKSFKKDIIIDKREKNRRTKDEKC